MRINKFFSDAGVCGRRQADRFIEEGRVKVNGETAVPGMQVEEGDTVTLDGKPIAARNDEYEYLILYKPRGITCTSDPRRRDNIIDFLNYPKRVFTVGRLDRDSEGLIMLTDNGNIVNKLLRVEYGHEKEYHVEIAEKIDKKFLDQMRSGVPVLGRMTLPCKVKQLGPSRFSITLKQGLNRQIRRMCAYCGKTVLNLKRVRFMHITLSGMQPGDYRKLTPKEVAEMKRLIKKHEAESADKADKKRKKKQ